MNPREAAHAVAKQLAAAGIDDASLEAEVLVRKATGLTRERYFAGECGDTTSLAGLVERRLAREPLAYLVGWREFYGREFLVNPNVLIPRQESELLVELALGELTRTPGAVVADIGTGSGCIAISIDLERKDDGPTIGVDRSRTALVTADANRMRHGSRVELVQGDLSGGLEQTGIVVANLPYIPAATLESLAPEVRDWEPRSALAGGSDGLDLIRRLIADCAGRLHPQFLALECDPVQIPAIQGLLAQSEACDITVLRDLQGLGRVVSARWRGNQ